MIGAGKRDRVIEVQTSITARSRMGPEKAAAWTRYCSPFAWVRYGTGQERREAATEGASQPATFRVLATAKTRAIEPAGFRLVFGKRANGDPQAWDITGAVPIGRAEIEITAIAAKG